MEKGKLAGAVSAAGPSLLERLWEQLDLTMEQLMEWPQSIEVPRWRGVAQGLATAISVIEQPYNPNMKEVRERAMERWEERHGEQE